MTGFKQQNKQGREHLQGAKTPHRRLSGGTRLKNRHAKVAIIRTVR